MFDQVLIDEGKALEDTQSLLSHDNGKDCGDGSRLKMGSGRDEDRDFVFRDEVFRDIELQDDPISHTSSKSATSLLEMGAS